MSTQDVKNVLNRFFGNEDLFDEKMNLKEQSVKRPMIPPPLVHRDEERVPGSKEVKERQNKLKPIQKVTSTKINNISNNQDDFWNTEAPTGPAGDRKVNPKQKLPSFKK